MPDLLASEAPPGLVDRGGHAMADESPADRGPGRAKLAELGYKQELDRGWSRFSNFAISFTIISVLAGCFTTYPQAWNLGGPVAISWGWPIVCLIVLTVAFSMAEVASAYPTAGGPYWWANELGGTGWSWFTGWFNLLGLVAIVATVDWFCAQFFVFVFNLWGLDLGIINFADAVDRSSCRDLRGLRGDPAAARADQHLLVAPGRAVQQHLGVLALRRRGGDHRHPDHRPRQPPERRLRVHRAAQQLRLLDGHVLVLHPAHRACC